MVVNGGLRCAPPALRNSKGVQADDFPKDGAEEFVGFVGQAALHELVNEAASVGGRFKKQVASSFLRIIVG
jgi:hypothetical protein